MRALSKELGSLSKIVEEHRGWRMKLYDQAQAPNPRRVRIFMAEKGISCETVQVNIVAGENLGTDFLSISPRGLLPCLVLDDGSVIDESIAICRYFEELQPDPLLLGSTPIERAGIAARERHMEQDGLCNARDAFRNSFPGFKSRGVGGNVGDIPAIPELAERGKTLLARFYERLDEYLASHRYVVDDHFTIADITALCAIDFGIRASRVPVSERLVYLLRWHSKVSARPSAMN